MIKYRIMLYIFDEIDKLEDLPMDLLSDERREKVHRYRSTLGGKLSVVVYLRLIISFVYS